jgi:hypothetical protein
MTTPFFQNAVVDLLIKKKQTKINFYRTTVVLHTAVSISLTSEVNNYYFPLLLFSNRNPVIILHYQHLILL